MNREKQIQERERLIEGKWRLIKKDVMDLINYSVLLQDLKLEQVKEKMERSYEKTRENYRV